MKKSLIKSLLPVLIVVLALSMISITVVADNYTGYVYDPENPCETIDQIKYDGLNRVKTALPDEEKPGKYDGLNEEKYALEDEEKPGKYDGLDEEKYALEDEEKPGKYDGLNEEKCALEPTKDNGKYDGLDEPDVAPPPAGVTDDGHGHGIAGASRGASVTGTGPTVYGLFDREDRAREACARLSQESRETFLCRTV